MSSLVGAASVDAGLLRGRRSPLRRVRSLGSRALCGCWSGGFWCDGVWVGGGKKRKGGIYTGAEAGGNVDTDVMKSGNEEQHSGSEAKAS